MQEIELFGNNLQVKDYLCSPDKNIILPANPRLRLYVKVTDDCNAYCAFCANVGNEDFGKLDINKLRFVVEYLKNKQILHGVSITGGEPMINPSKLNNIINMILDVDPNIEIEISTNGKNVLEFAKFDHANDIYAIHVSRHHYEDDKNNEIFRSKMATSKDLYALQEQLEDKKILVINTMVMKDGINNLEEIKNNLDFVGDLGIFKNGFVSLMKNNLYSKAQFINYNDIFNNLDSSFMPAHRFFNKDYCECIDGLYLTKNYKLVEYYARMVKEATVPYTNQLVYTSDNKLLSGFSGKVLHK